ncbi:hypothetical protein [Salinigranum marinum]|uniref:hypothetical protein n=1 Tax=Salinigranum marinum TaxID=1515595 RepID=UPI002989B5AB|nr:hypothetical protein [Salinigranum marinum]
MTEYDRDRTNPTRSDTRSSMSNAFGSSHGASLRGRRTLAIVALLALAALARIVPLYWSPHPATLDGFQYAWFAREALATGSYPISEFRVDSFVYTGLIAVVSGVLGVVPIRLTQPLSSLVGVGGVFVGIALARHVAGSFGWSRRRVTVATIATGLLLAVDGIYLRRTMVADEEVMAYVLLPLAVLAIHSWLSGRRGSRAWGVLSLLFLFVFPPFHVLSTLVLGLTLLALVVAHIVRSPTRRTVLGGGVVTVGFWLSFGSYYALAESTSVTVPYVDRVTAFPGLFLAWGIILAVGAAWVLTTTRRARVAAFVLPILALYAVTVVNVFVSVYPGTPRTPLIVLLPVVALFVPVLVGGLGMSQLSPGRPSGAMVLALLAGPLAIVGFSLTASLTPEYVNTAIRAQTFGHLPVAILAGLVLSGLVSRRVGSAIDAPSRGRTGRYLLVALVLVAAVASLPFAYLVLDTGAYPSTTFDSEFRGVQFASEATSEPWTTDHSLSRVGILYFRSDVSVEAAASFLSGGTSPTCPVVSQTSWTTTGAHLFPFAPETISEARYDGWLDRRSVVYANTGRDPVTVSVPATAASGGC